jgi:CubicO group peptidase (beta-lactamase class C family)
MLPQVPTQGPGTNAGGKATGSNVATSKLSPSANYSRIFSDNLNRASGSAILDRDIREIIKKYSYPGGSVAISRYGKLVFSKSYGVKDVSNAPFTAYTLCPIASTSKPITAFAILCLVNDGKLGLDDPAFRIIASKYPGRFANVIRNDPRLGLITIRQLLHHTAGFGDPHNLFPNYSMALEAKAKNHSFDSVFLLEKMLSSPLAHSPGEIYKYSNANYVFLNLIIEAISLQTYEQYVTQRVFKSISIEGVLFSSRDNNNNVSHIWDLPNRTAPSALSSSLGIDVPISYGGIDYSLMGLWCLSAKDLLIFADTVSGYNAALIDRKLLEEIYRIPPHVNNRSFNGDTMQYYGLGWNIYNHLDQKKYEFEHIGEMSGAVSGLRTRIDGYTVSFVFNSSNGQYDSAVKVLTSLNETINKILY